MALQTARWKRAVGAQLPYRMHLRRLRLGRTLDVGCGIGRNLDHLGGAGVGVDHNADAIRVCRDRGLSAFTDAEFPTSEPGLHGGFDSLLFSHVLEHMTVDDACNLVQSYLPYVVPEARVVFIAPQERGFRSDETHVTFLDFEVLSDIASRCRLTVERQYSFPLPRSLGRVFPYNEFVVLARRARRERDSAAVAETT